MSRVTLSVDSYEGNDTPSSEIARFVVLYGKSSSRKRKIWEGDGILVCFNDSWVLKSEDERDVICRSSAMKNLDQLEDGRVVNIGSWSVEIQNRIESPTSAPALEAEISQQSSAHIILGTKENRKRAGYTNQISSLTTMSQKRTFLPPLIGSDSINEKLPPIILNEKDIINRKSTSAIIVDPRFSRHLRAHQKEGIKFIFDKLKDEKGGVILADGMGLGKSIQTMAATWALLKGSKSTTQIANSCLIIVPCSLVNNWKAEFEKWWRFMRFPAVIALNVKDISVYQSTVKMMPYLVISYDMALRHVEKLKMISFDIVVCDEGHKLKNLDSRLRGAILSLEIPRRLILTGTPMQNDFDEFYSLLDIVRPSEFGKPADFKKMCNDDPEKLNEMVDQCMLRRTAADVRLSHLPEKHEYILFCAASSIQKDIHSEICDYMTGDALSLIFFARQLANHPKLLLDNLREKNRKSETRSLKQAQKHSALLLAFDGPNLPRGGVKESGKLSALVDMLKCFRMLRECAVIVSNYIETLDMIAQLCEYLEFRVFRLDGKTQVTERQKLVRIFNDQRDPCNVFLLSTKAGGVGLNLIGASRLVLFDSDWNPANDQQAMARIWRDGQVRPCHIYRLITTGTIEEKMLQRQIKKTGLGCVIDAIEVGDAVATFTDEDLKDIFTFTGDLTECNTHDLCGCPCDGNGLLENEMDEDEDEKGTDGEDVTQIKTVQGDDSDGNEEVDDEELEGDTPTDITLEEKDEVVDHSQEKYVAGKQKEISEESEKIQKSEQPRTVASLAELFGWRHFSPRHQETWQFFMKNAGLSQVDTDVELTFAFYLQSQY